MATFKITDAINLENPNAGDLHLLNGDLVWLGEDTEAEKVEAISQHIRSRLRTFLGEYFLDERIGIPFFRDVFVKAPDLEIIRSIFSQGILNTPGVVQLTELRLDLDRSTRELSIAFEAIVDTGDPLWVGYDQPFIIEV